MAALRHAGVRALPGRSQEPLSLDWEALRARLPDKDYRYGLSRLMHFCCRQGISPDRVDSTVFEGFRSALENESLVRKAPKVYRTTCVLWNRAARTIPGWPAVQIAEPDARRRYALGWSAFPPSFQADVEAYLARIANQDVFADDYARSVRPSTVKTRRHQFQLIATALARSGYPADQITGLATLANPNNAKLALRFFMDRAGGTTTTNVHYFARVLKAVARHWVKPTNQEDIELLSTLCRRLAVNQSGMTAKNRARLRQFDDPANLDAVHGLEPRKQAGPGGVSTVEEAVEIPGTRFVIKGNRCHRGVDLMTAGSLGPNRLTEGVMLTPGVDEELWLKYAEQNKDADLIRNGIVFAFPSEKKDHPKGRAKEEAERKSGLEPLEVGGPGEKSPDWRVPRVITTGEK
ncbi:MAG TPA: hypothetical protein VLW88_13060 [Hyphomicrobium sp.]|nr:hypothetical protein [Hyphomicrobium sp.]